MLNDRQKRRLQLFVGKIKARIFYLNIFLIFIVLITFFYDYVQSSRLHEQLYSYFNLISANDYKKATLISAVIRNIIYTLAAIVAGVWTYYTFVKGRTFKPKVTVSVNLKSVSGEYNEIAIISVKFRNDGKSKVRPLSAPTEFYKLVRRNSGIDYVKFHTIDNILSEYYLDHEKWHLEPKDEMNIDFPLILNSIDGSGNAKDGMRSLVMVKVLFVDKYLNAWKEHSILNTEKER